MITITHFADYISANYTAESSPKAPALRISTRGSLATYYSPFDYVNTSAKLCVVGITPGATQAHMALSHTAELMRSGYSANDAIREAKCHASFGGAMRRNLVHMLDSIGLNATLGLSSCSALFDAGSPLAHFTSALMYPVFKDGKDYNGTPCITKNDYLRGQAFEYLQYQTEKLAPEVMWLPLGPAPTRFLRAACEEGLIQPAKILEGLPHPSGANAERIAVFTGRKRPEDASSRTDPSKLLAARERLIATLA
jgi:hypothetical protein